MNKVLQILSLNLLILLCSPPALAAAELKIAVVNVTDLYNKSSFVKEANKNLQAHAQSMEKKVQAEKIKLQKLVTKYENINDAHKKKSLVKEITAEQAQVNSMTQEFQKKIQEEQNAGLQKFTLLVKEAVEKVAKEKHFNTVINSTSVVYSDNTWVDITNEVQSVMKQN